MENSAVIVLALCKQVKVDAGDGMRLIGGMYPVRIVSKRKKKSGKISDSQGAKSSLFSLKVCGTVCILWYTLYMDEFKGWKNETTWTINVFFMETMEEMLKSGSSEDAIEEHIKRQLNQDLYLEQRNILGCALKLVDWYTLFARAKENIKELV